MQNHAHFRGGSPSQSVSLDFLQNAITQSSLGVAICDQDLNVRFCNAAISRFLLDEASNFEVASTPCHGETLLRCFGLTDLSSALACVAPGFAWRGIGRVPDCGDLAARCEFHIAIEYFLGPDDVGGWLITAQKSVVAARERGIVEREQITKSQKLTEREKQIVLALNMGQTNKAIARELGISPRTVEFHRSRILKRFGVNSVVELIRKVICEADSGGDT